VALYQVSCLVLHEFTLTRYLTFLLRTLKKHYQNNRITYINNVNFTSICNTGVTCFISLHCVQFVFQCISKDGIATCRLYCHVTDRFPRSVAYCDPKWYSSRLFSRLSTRLRSLTCYSAPYQNAVHFVQVPQGSVSFINLESVNGSSVHVRFSFNSWE
jgi:hypothetical protein